MTDRAEPRQRQRIEPPVMLSDGPPWWPTLFRFGFVCCTIGFLAGLGAAALMPWGW